MQHNRRTQQSVSFSSRRRRRAVLFLIIVAIIFVLGLTTLSWFSRLPFWTINVVRVEGVGQDLAALIEPVAENAISGSYFGIFSKSNAVIYPRGAVINSIKSAVPQVDSVEVHINDLRQISVIVKARTPDAIICFDFPSIDTNTDTGSTTDQCYDADSTGMIYSSHMGSSDNTMDKYYVPNREQISSSTILGTYATSTQEFVKLQSFYKSARNSGLNISSVLIKSAGEFEMYIRNDDSSIAIVYFNEMRPLADQFKNLLSFWNYMVTDKRAVGNAASFDYIDVRYGSNVFYRENGGTASKS